MKEQPNHSRQFRMNGEAMFSMVFTDAKDRKQFDETACLQTIAARLG
jgi:hypothetical protein